MGWWFGRSLGRLSGGSLCWMMGWSSEGSSDRYSVTLSGGLLGMLSGGSSGRLSSGLSSTSDRSPNYCIYEVHYFGINEKNMPYNHYFGVNPKLALRILNNQHIEVHDFL